MKNIIITGANGQLGQHLILYIQNNYPEYQIIGTIRHKSFDEQPLLYSKNNIILELMDLNDPISIENLINQYKPIYFINTAANAFVGESWLVPVQHFQVNTLGIVYQLEAIRKFSPNTRYFNCGSSEEFGNVKYSPQDAHHPLSPRSPYGASKCAARMAVKVYRESYNLYAIQGWMFNYESIIRGPKYLPRKISKGVARIYHAINNGLTFNPISTGNIFSQRDWSDCYDICDGIWKMLNQDNPKEYVLASGQTHSVKKLIELAFSSANIKGHWIHKDDYLKIKYMTDEEYSRPLVIIDSQFFRPAEVDLLCGDSTAAREELGWKPQISFEQLISEMVKHDIENP